MNNYLNEDRILDKAYKSLKESFEVQMSYKREFGSETDYRLEIIFSLHNKQIKKNYSVEIERRVLSTTIGQLLIKKKKLENLLLVADDIPPRLANKLRELDIPFIDGNGNVFLNEAEFYIFVNTFRQEARIQRSSSGLIFQPSGLQLLFVLLSIPNSENKTYRELSAMSGISLGSVSEIMNTLQSEYYLVKENEERNLFRKDELLKRWVQGFAETLHSKLSEIRFESDDNDWWKEADLTPARACWSGEIAAEMLTNHLNPAKGLIYTKGSFLSLVNKFNLRRAVEGNIKVRRKFWNFDEEDIIAPPLLVYADLLATAESRSVEAAEIIYDKYLAGLIE
ncbi:type IV toxin-antitoxin system AbiEi family antitoxin [soil metagenome]